MRLFRNLLRDPETKIDDRIHFELGLSNIKNYTVSEKDFPAYRFVDIFRAINSKLESESNVRTIESDNYETLSSLIHAETPQWGSRQIARSVRTAWPIGPNQESYLPVDFYWIYSKQDTAISC